MAKGLLISYAGYPYSPSCLMPDNGLASLAAVLLRDGHEVTILDYGTVAVLDRLMPGRLSLRLVSLFDMASNSHPSVAKVIRNLYGFFTLKATQRHLEKHRKREINRIADELSAIIGKRKPDFVGFKLWMGDGFSGAAHLARRIRKDHPRIKLCPKTRWRALRLLPVSSTG